MELGSVTIGGLMLGVVGLFLAWVFYYTRNWAVLVNLVWELFHRLIAPGLVHKWLLSQAGIVDGQPYNRAMTPQMWTGLEAWNLIVNVLDTALFVWMLWSLMRWGRRRVSKLDAASAMA